MLISVRVHYISDILGGYVVGHYIHHFVDKYLCMFDVVFSLPYMLVLELYKLIKKCEI
jgi:hypothetical protein